ncbi:MAG TPA: ubiquinol-cytochrome c reductase iron-sulfur subunit [Bacteroidetes bacterium]|nr:cytochrome b6-f complex iron-sulfur subunit [bacterium BMS3Bbin04]HDO65120.1 ubiquinol-cytochrome c reductase iron-sulfur subunit [Bacteroidota bacterium]HEX04245.1 ubiquinol-cytochrome c reductase iron-sulfur subunit [Bacteroidota bacterium]
MNDKKQNPTQTRRTFLGRLSVGFIGLSLFSGLWVVLKSLIPNVLYEPPKRFKIGDPNHFQSGVSYLEEHKLYIFKQGNSFFAISGVCTHLGCTVKFSPFNQEKQITVRGKEFTETGEFLCPCHGSKFHGEGTNYAGPAPRPLKWHRLDLAQDDGQLIVDIATEVDRDFRLVV